MTGYEMDEEAYEALKECASAPGGVGPELVFACNVDSNDTIGVRRVGPHAGGKDSRAEFELQLIGGTADPEWVYLSAPECRMLAAHLLNIADDIDGEVVLNNALQEAPVARPHRALFATGERARVKGNDGRVNGGSADDPGVHHYLTVPAVVDVLEVDIPRGIALVMGPSAERPGERMEQYVSLVDLEPIA